jgi:hypothetical protein
LQPTRHLEWLLIVCCVVLCALFGVAFAFDDDDDPGACLLPADGPWCSPDEGLCAPPVIDAPRLVAGPDRRTSAAGPALLAAVPGGLCLLI